LTVAWVTHTLASGLVIINQQAIVVDVFPNFQLTLEWLKGA
jgi:hypothetical protein